MNKLTKYNKAFFLISSFLVFGFGLILFNSYLRHDLKNRVETLVSAIKIQQAGQGLVFNLSGIAPYLIHSLENNKRFIVCNISIIDGPNWLQKHFCEYDSSLFKRNLNVKLELKETTVELNIIATESVIGEMLFFAILLTCTFVFIVLSVRSFYSHITNFEMQILATKTAHDIRSPLVSLAHLIESNDRLKGDEKELIQTQMNRIMYIADCLLITKRKKRINLTKKSKVFLVLTLQEVIKEKELEYNNNINIELLYDLNVSTSKAISEVNSEELKSIISNLINNCVESFIKSKGRIRIKLGCLEDKVIISIIDNGGGIKKETLEKLGKKVISSEREGNGIGVYNALSMVKSWNGQLKVSSKLNFGTIVKITLPRCSSPDWFAEELNLKNDTPIVCIDDDPLIHDFWRRNIPQSNKLFNFQNLKSFESWIKSEGFKDKSFFYLVDYELGDNERNGLDIISQYNLCNSLLVTSTHLDKNIIDKCSKLSIKILPKPFLKKLNINFISSTDMFQAVHLDDDPYIRKLWSRASLKAGVNLLSVDSEDRLFGSLNLVDKDTQFYIDESLGEHNRSGQKITKELVELGFKNVYLATGYDPQDFENLTYLKGIVGKRPVFRL